MSTQTQNNVSGYNDGNGIFKTPINDLNASNVQALVLVMDSQLTSRLNELNKQTASTEQELQVAYTSADYAAAKSQKLIGINQGLGSVAMGVGSGAISIGATQDIYDNQTAAKDYENQLKPINDEDTLLDKMENADSSVSVNIDEDPDFKDLSEEDKENLKAKQTEYNNGDKTAIKQRRSELKKQKEKVSKDYETKSTELRSKSSQRMSVAQSLQYLGAVTPQIMQSAAQASATKQNAVSTVNKDADQKMAQVISADNQLIQTTLSSAGTVYQVSVAASRG